MGIRRLHIRSRNGYPSSSHSFSQCTAQNFESGMCEKTPAWTFLSFAGAAPPPPNVQCCCELERMRFTKTGVYFAPARAPPKLTATLNIGGLGAAPAKDENIPAGFFFRTYRNRNFAWCIARKNVKTTNSPCESECVNDRCPSVRPSVRHTMLRRVSSQHFLIRGPSFRHTMLRRVSSQHFLIRDVTPPRATSRHHTSPYVTPLPVKPNHVRSRCRTSHHVTSHVVMPRHVPSSQVTSRHVSTCHVHVMSFSNPSHTVSSCLLTCFLVLSCFFI